jgi:F0F1-type ATP synthase membrane subunit b/b'
MLILFTLFYSVINKIILPQISKVLKIRKKILQYYVESTRELYLESISALEFNIKMIDNSLGEALASIQSTINHSNTKVSEEISKSEQSVLKDANTQYLNAIGNIQMIELHEEASIKGEFSSIRNHFGI